MSAEIAVLPTFLCSCGHICGTNEADQVYCNNRRCGNYGKVFTVKIVIEEVKPSIA